MYMVVDGGWSLKVSKLSAEARDNGSCWFQIRMVLGKKEKRCAFTVDYGIRNLML